MQGARSLMTSASRESSNRREVGRYHLVAELARGGMGNVYLAATQGPGGFEKIVVLKELKPEFAHDETYVSMFLDEARLAARLTHPNIVQTNEVASDGSRHYMVMEFLDGRSLYRLLRYFAHSSLFPIGAHLRIIAEAVLGLDYAHELRGFDGEPLGVVHRDVSPLNIVVTFDGQTKILDFGIAKAVDSSLETRAGTLKGRVAYMAPEQARGAKVDRRADIYALGVMIWEAAARRRLWPAMTEVQILTRILGAGAPSLRSVVPDAPADLDALCSRAMAPDPADRYPTAAALSHDLEAHLARRTDVPTMRAIGMLLSHTFREERQKTNVAIDETLIRLRGGSRSGVMPVFQNPIADTRATDSTDLVVDMGSLSSLPEETPSRRSIGTAYGSPGSSAGDLILDTASTSRWRGKRTIAIAAAAGVLVAAGFVAIAWHATSHGRPVVAETAVRAPAVAVESPAVNLTAPTSPPQVLKPIESVSIPRDPPFAKSQRDEPVRRAVVFAPKYVAAEPIRRPAAVPDAPPAAAPASHPDVDPAGGRAPLRPIVTNNPYGSP
jgi:eukaryotic-like serine/threonine-protein kinase